MSLDESKHVSVFKSISITHWLVILASFSITFTFYLFSRNQVKIKNEYQFKQNSNNFLDIFSDRMTHYEDAIASSIAFFNSSKLVEYYEWNSYSSSLNIHLRHPGVSGIGVINRVYKKDLKNYIKKQKEHTASWTLHPFEEREIYLPIAYVTPKERNIEAFGLDMMFEKNRREAALATIESGKPNITGPISLVQDAGQTPGFLLFYPYYKTKDIPKTMAERKKQFEGFVYSPFIFKNLIHGILSKETRDIRVRISDGGVTLYDETTDFSSFRRGNKDYYISKNLNIYGRPWQVDIYATESFISRSQNYIPITIFIAGVLINFILVLLFIILGNKSRKATTLAHQANVDLREKTKLLSKSNQDLEKFANIASHDLKEPLRNIEALSSILEEELSEKINDDQKSLLSKLKERVYWMEKLVDDLLSYSKLSKSALDINTVNLKTEIEEIISLIANFGEAEYHFNSHFPKIRTSRFAIRLILRNIIDNAIKHNNKNIPEIHFLYFVDDLYHIIYVEDNGPGVPPEHRDQVFEMFKTLNSPNAGSGMGLAFVKKVTEELNWEVRVTLSEVLGGAKVIIRIPKA